MHIDLDEEIRLIRASVDHVKDKAAELEDYLASRRRHEVQFLNLTDILAALEAQGHSPDCASGLCDCRFCLTQPMIKIS